MKTGLAYLMFCSFAAGWYCARNDVAGELKTLYDEIVDYTAGRAAVARHRSDRELELAAAGERM